MSYCSQAMPMDRRSLLKRTALFGAATLLPAALRAEAVAAAAGPALRIFTKGEYDVVVEATARLIPGPSDDPSEAGHPGAREAMAVRYIDGLLGALRSDPARVYASGPFSSRGGTKTDDMERFVPLTPAQTWAWERRLEGWRRSYVSGIVSLDRLAHGSFVVVSTSTKDKILARDPEGFTTLLFGHAIEAMYSVPEYGGNADLVGWRDIGFPGDTQPMGYAPNEVSSSSGPDPYVPDEVAQKVIGLVSAA
jgi:Gluconate 2-dehydrogenase subunit 3